MVLFRLSTLFNATSSSAPQIPLCRRMLGLNSELLHRLHWQLDAISHPVNSYMSVDTATL